MSDLFSGAYSTYTNGAASMTTGDMTPAKLMATMCYMREMMRTPIPPMPRVVVIEPKSNAMAIENGDVILAWRNDEWRPSITNFSRWWVAACLRHRISVNAYMINFDPYAVTFGATTP